MTNKEFSEMKRIEGQINKEKEQKDTALAKEIISNSQNLSYYEKPRFSSFIFGNLESNSERFTKSQVFTAISGRIYVRVGFYHNLRKVNTCFKKM